MSVDLAADASPATSRSLDRTARQRAWALRKPVLIGGLVVVAALLISLATSTPHNYLDPNGADPQGGRALRVLIEDGGVQVSRTTSVPEALTALGGRSQHTLLVNDVSNLVPQQLSVLFAAQADLVLLNPSLDSLTTLVPELIHPRFSSRGAIDPSCDLPAALRAGRVDAGGVSYAAADGADVVLCYLADGEGSVVQVRRPGGRLITVVGQGDAFTNDRLAGEGNAALALGLLGAHPDLVWLVAEPALVGDATGDASITELLPRWIGLALWQTLVLVGLLALWRGRRFGPVVVEHLPVVVRAAEATEGRARLYRRSRARDRASENLRTATRLRLAAAVGVPVVAGRLSASPDALVSVVAARTGRPPTDVSALLFGGIPPNDPALVRLANELDSLERTVGHA